MIKIIIGLSVLALTAALLGFTGLAYAASGIAKVIFYCLLAVIIGFMVINKIRLHKKNNFYNQSDNLS